MGEVVANGGHGWVEELKMVMTAEVNEALGLPDMISIGFQSINTWMARALVAHFSCAKVMINPVMRNAYKEYDCLKASGATLSIWTSNPELMNRHGLYNAGLCASG